MLPWPEHLTLENAATVAGLVGDGASALRALRLASAAPPEIIALSAAALDSAVSRCVMESLEIEPSMGTDFMRTLGPLFVDWHQTVSAIMEHRDAGKWVERCNREGVPLATQTLRSVRGPFTAVQRAALNNLAGLGVRAIAGPGEGGLLPWQVGVLHGILTGHLPLAWRAADCAEIKAGLAALLDAAWPRGTWNRGKRLQLVTLWNRISETGASARNPASPQATAEALTDLLTGYLLTSPVRHDNADTPPAAALSLMAAMPPGGWLRASTLSPDDKGGVRREAEGWPLAAAILLATLLNPGTGQHGLGGHSDGPGATRMVLHALKAVEKASPSDLDRPLPVNGKPGPTLRGLAILCGASFVATTPSETPPPPTGQGDLRAAMATREAMETFAKPQALADIDRWLVGDLLQPAHAASGQTLMFPDAEARTDACLRLLGYGLRAKAEGTHYGEMAKTLVYLQQLNPGGLARRADTLDPALLLALARAPELLACYHMQSPDGVAGGTACPPFPFPGGKDGSQKGWLPRRLANMAAWEHCVANELGAGAVDRTRWFEASVEVFKDACHRDPAWLGSDAAARWLSEQMDKEGGVAVRGLSSAGVKALLPQLLTLLQARHGEMLPPGCAFKMARWLDGCADHTTSARAAIEAMQTWKAWSANASAPGPGALFVAGGLGDVSALRGACEKVVASGGYTPTAREAIANTLLAPWQAASLAPASAGSRRQRSRS